MLTTRGCRGCFAVHGKRHRSTDMLMVIAQALYDVDLQTFPGCWLIAIWFELFQTAKLSKEQNKVVQCLLTLALVICAIPFAHPHIVVCPAFQLRFTSKRPTLACFVSAALLHGNCTVTTTMPQRRQTCLKGARHSELRPAGKEVQDFARRQFGQGDAR